MTIRSNETADNTHISPIYMFFTTNVLWKEEKGLGNVVANINHICQNLKAAKPTKSIQFNGVTITSIFDNIQSFWI